VVDGYWISEQWKALSAKPGVSDGWRLKIRLIADTQKSLTHQSDWQINLKDPAIGARVLFRSSLQSLDQHHQTTIKLLGEKVLRPSPTGVGVQHERSIQLSRLQRGDVVVSGSASGSRYSVVIQRVFER
ncbi:MAG: hypothetical protein RLZZ192_893, partial [Pseudomonadota bacterium]